MEPSAGTCWAGRGNRYGFEYAGADTAIAINRLLKRGAAVTFDAPSHVTVTGVGRGFIDALARELGLKVAATDADAEIRDALRASNGPSGGPLLVRAPRVGLYAPWSGGNIDEGWTRWVLEQYEFSVVTLHNEDIRAGDLKQKVDAIILPDQSPRDILDGFTAATVRPEYRGGLGDEGMDKLQRFLAAGGTLVTLGAASDLVIDRLLVTVRDVKRGLRREQHSAPGSILNIEVDTTHPLGYGMAAQTYGFYNNSPFFGVLEGATAQKATVVVRYPPRSVVASGWLRGEELMAGRAAVVSVDMNPGRVVLFGLRPQHRAQTHATFPLLFNALYLSAADSGTPRLTQ